MTFHIAKSLVDALGYDFAAEIAKHIKALEDHRISGDAAPHSYPDVEAAVRRVQYPISEQKPDDFVADYAIVDDAPPPLTLAERKAIARAEIQKEEQAEIDALIAPEKVRFEQMKFQRAASVDERDRSAADKKVVADWQALIKRIDDIRFIYAERESAIADMQ